MFGSHRILGEVADIVGEHGNRPFHDAAGFAADQGAIDEALAVLVGVVGRYL